LRRHDHINSFSRDSRWAQTGSKLAEVFAPMKSAILLKPRYSHRRKMKARDSLLSRVLLPLYVSMVLTRDLPVEFWPVVNTGQRGSERGNEMSKRDRDNAREASRWNSVLTLVAVAVEREVKKSRRNYVVQWPDIGVHGAGPAGLSLHISTADWIGLNRRRAGRSPLLRFALTPIRRLINSRLSLGVISGMWHIAVRERMLRAWIIVIVPRDLY
jgi:hypothetical protein